MVHAKKNKEINKIANNSITTIYFAFFILPPGIYLAVVKEGATIVASAKFVVAK